MSVDEFSVGRVVLKTKRIFQIVKFMCKQMWHYGHFIYGNLGLHLIAAIFFEKWSSLINFHRANMPM